MEVTINYNGQAVAVEVTLEVYEFLCAILALYNKWLSITTIGIKFPPFSSPSFRTSTNKEEP